MGVGLALARRLVEMHDGEISGLSDGPGHGSTFIIEMTRFENTSQEIAAQADTPRVANRVVIIDDNEDAANTLSMLVQQLGGTSKTAYDALTGLDVVISVQPDTVLLDIGMPGIDGYEACRRLRAQQSQSKVNITALSGWGQPDDRQRALDAGFDMHLTKPIGLETLARVLRGDTLPRLT